jgi:hypothetical protein
MFRKLCIRIMFGALVATLAIVVNPAASQTATADELQVVPLTGQSEALQRGSDGLVKFIRGITLKAGPGHRSGPVQLGLWRAQGFPNGYKFEFTAHHGVPTNGDVPNMSTEDSRCVKTIVYRYRGASRQAAAAAAITILNRQNEPSWRKYYHWQVKHHRVAKRLQKLVAKLGSQCKRHSPFHASMQTEPVYAGQVGSGTVKVLAAGGLSAPAWLHVRTESVGSRIVRSAHRLNGHGSAGFSYRLSNPEDARATSTVTGPDATRADLLVTPDGNTRLLVNTYKASAQASSKLRQKVLPKPTVSFKNPYASNGTGTVLVKAKVPAKAGQRVRFTARNGGKNHRWTVRPGHKGSAKFKAVDASQVALSYCYVKRAKGKCLSKVHEYGHTAEVVAPAWIDVDGQDHCCTSKGTTVELSLSVNPDTTRFYRAWVIVNGKTVQTLDLSKSAGSVPQTVHIKKGSVQVKFTAYKNNDRTGSLLTEYITRSYS